MFFSLSLIFSVYAEDSKKINSSADEINSTASENNENQTEETSEKNIEPAEEKVPVKKEMFSLSLRPDLSFMTGDIKEYVVDPKCPNTDNVVSRLDWHIKGMPVISIDAKGTFFKYGFINVDAKLGVPNSNSTIEDYDWLNYMNNKWKNDSPTEVTNYSCSTNVIQKYSDVSVFLGGNFYIPYDVTISPFIGYHYDFVEMDAQNGYYSYKKNDWSELPLHGRGIKYKQESNAFMVGMNILADSLPHFTFESSYRVSPYLFFLQDLDYHYTRELIFYDKMDNTFSFEMKHIIMFDFGSRKEKEPSHSFGVTGYMHYLKFVEGSTSTGKITSNGSLVQDSFQRSNGIAGASRFLWSVGLIYQLKIN